MNISALYIKPEDNSFVICILSGGKVQTVHKKNTDFNTAVKTLDKIAGTQPGLYKFAFENLYVNPDMVTDVHNVDNQIFVTCDGKDFIVATSHSLNNARNYAKLLRQNFNLENKNELRH